MEDTLRKHTFDREAQFNPLKWYAAMRVKA